MSSEEAAARARRDSFVHRDGPRSATRPRFADEDGIGARTPPAESTLKVLWLKVRPESLERARELFEASLVERPAPWGSEEAFFREAFERGLADLAREVSP